MFMVTRVARWFFAPALAALLMNLTAWAIPGDAVAQPSDIQEQWDGTWAMSEQDGLRSYMDCCEGPGENVPLTPKDRKLRTEYAAIPFTSSEMNEYANLPRCITPGMPGILTHPLLFDFSWSPGRVNITFNDGSYRRIWTDGRTFPERLRPMWLGTSIGHWEGSTLVVETRGISRKSEMFMMGRIRPGPQTKVTERITLREEPFKAAPASDPVKRYLHLQLTIEDPEIFSEPYTRDLRFVVVPVSFEAGCAANNRDDGMSKMDLTPPADE